MITRLATEVARLLGPVWRFRTLGLCSEALYWELWIRSRQQEVQRRLDPQLPLPQDLDSVVRRIAARRVRVLEVGAGPISMIGRVHPQKDIDLVPTDVLADTYRRILNRHRIEPPVPTVMADAESLTAVFSHDSFDVVYACNALDHMSNPLRAIEEMVNVIRPGGWIALHHRCNEGERQNYSGLHRWNVAEEDGRFLLWNPREMIDISDRLGSYCDVFATTDGEFVRVEITKRVRRSATEDVRRQLF